MEASPLIRCHVELAHAALGEGRADKKFMPACEEPVLAGRSANDEAVLFIFEGEI